MPHAVFKGADDAPKAYWSAIRWASNARLTVLHDGHAHRFEHFWDAGWGVAGLPTRLPAPALDYAVSEDGNRVLALTKGGGTSIVDVGTDEDEAEEETHFDNGNFAREPGAPLEARSLRSLRVSGDSYHWASPTSERLIMRVRQEEWSPVLRHCSEPARFVAGADEWRLFDAGQASEGAMKDPTQQYAFMAWAPCATKVIMRKSQHELVVWSVLDDGSIVERGAVAAPGVFHAAVSPDGERVAALTRSHVFVFRMDRFARSSAPEKGGPRE